MMKPFDFYSPQTLPETLQLLSAHGTKAVVIAGGTDLMIELNEGKVRPEAVINIKRLKGLDYIRLEEGVVRIGALTNFTSLAESSLLKQHVLLLQKAAATMGSPQIRNLATLGGNLATASVAGDGLAACATLEASVTLASTEGTRTMSMDDFMAGEGAQKRNALRADELLTDIFFTLPDARTATAFYKLARRKSLAISVIGGCLLLSVDAEGICRRVSLRAGALGRYPMRMTAAEDHLRGKKLSLALMRETLPGMHDAVLEANRSRPWSVYYKKESVKGVFDKLFIEAMEQLGLGAEA